MARWEVAGAVGVAERLLLAVIPALGAWLATLATLLVASPLLSRLQLVAFQVVVALARRSNAPIQPYLLHESHHP